MSQPSDNNIVSILVQIKKDGNKRERDICYPKADSILSAQVISLNENKQAKTFNLTYQNGLESFQIRLIHIFDSVNKSMISYVHAGDIGGVVERKSNISRLFGKFESPGEKMLLNVIGAHNYEKGQESNVLTAAGVIRFISTNKMKNANHYKNWLEESILPLLSDK